MMTSLCLYFKIHQPFQLKRYHSKEIGASHCYEDAASDEIVINRLSDSCYLPANKIMLSLIKKYRHEFKISFSISGTALELLNLYRPDVIKSFRKLVETGCVEILGETYYHSLSSLYSQNEFRRQVNKHSDAIFKSFGILPAVFRNTELIHNNALTSQINELGFKGILCEGIGRVLQGRSCNRIYASPEIGGLKLLLRNPQLSDDIAFRFDDTNWDQYPLTAEKFAGWVHQHGPDTNVINLFMDYETFGIHKQEASGIFEFLKYLPESILSNPQFIFNTPSHVLEEFEPVDIYDVPRSISWEGKSAMCIDWTKNVLQNNAIKKIYSLEKMVMTCGSPEFIKTWGKLQSADYFYYLNDAIDRNESHKYASPFSSVQETYQYYTNIIVDFEISLIKEQLARSKKKSLLAIGHY